MLHRFLASGKKLMRQFYNSYGKAKSVSRLAISVDAPQSTVHQIQGI